MKYEFAVLLRTAIQLHPQKLVLCNTTLRYPNDEDKTGRIDCGHDIMIDYHRDVLVSYLTSPSLLPHLSGALFWAAAAISSAMSAMSSERIVRLPHRSGEESLRLRTAAASASDTERLPHLIMDERYQLPVRTQGGEGEIPRSSTVLKVSCGLVSGEGVVKWQLYQYRQSYKGLVTGINYHSLPMRRLLAERQNNHLSI